MNSPTRPEINLVKLEQLAAAGKTIEEAAEVLEIAANRLRPWIISQYLWADVHKAWKRGKERAGQSVPKPAPVTIDLVTLAEKFAFEGIPIKIAANRCGVHVETFKTWIYGERRPDMKVAWKRGRERRKTNAREKIISTVERAKPLAAEPVNTVTHKEMGLQKMPAVHIEELSPIVEAEFSEPEPPRLIVPTLTNEHTLNLSAGKIEIRLSGFNFFQATPRDMMLLTRLIGVINEHEATK